MFKKTTHTCIILYECLLSWASQTECSLLWWQWKNMCCVYSSFIFTLNVSLLLSSPCCCFHGLSVSLCGRDFWAPLNLLVQFVRVFVLQLESVLLPITLCNSTQTSGMQCLENSICLVKITVLKPDLKALESIIYCDVQINSCLVPRPLACNLQLSLRICELHLQVLLLGSTSFLLLWRLFLLKGDQSHL